MPPLFALLLTIAFVTFLFARDVKEARVTGSLWIPVCWMLLTCSRPLSAWLGFGGASYARPSDLAEGGPLDRLAYLSLELAALFVLVRRRVPLGTVLSRNLWLTIFLAYCGLSIVWSDFPFASFKRWVKVLGLPMMVLLIATEPDPREAFARVMKRAAYVLIPFSILLVKYYPGLGRGYSPWGGEAFNTGVTTNKNELGYVCLILAFFFSWHLLTTLRDERTRRRHREIVLAGVFLVMTGWLLFAAK